MTNSDPNERGANPNGSAPPAFTFVRWRARDLVVPAGHLVPDGRAAAADRGADERTLFATHRRADPGTDARRRPDDDGALLHRSTAPHRAFVVDHLSGPNRPHGRA